MSSAPVELGFTDPSSDRTVTLVIQGPDPSFWNGTIGVRHGDCPTLADVSPDIDAFYCQACRWNGRVSGAWAIDMAEGVRTCTHESSTGVDGAPFGPDKVWRCEGCGWLHRTVTVDGISHDEPADP